MPRWDDEEVVYKLLTYDNAPCHSCVYSGGFGGRGCCEKYPPTWTIGVQDKPQEILDGVKPCEFYKKE